SHRSNDLSSLAARSRNCHGARSGIRPTASSCRETCLNKQDGSGPFFGNTLEQQRRELVQVVPPVDPAVSAAADVQLVLAAVLLQDLRQGFGAVVGKVLVADADREQLHRLVDL